jgi:predicted secreted protein
MASAAFSGVGTTFNRDSVAIAEINSITGPNMTRDFIDVTSLDSTGGYREFIAGFRDGGEITLEMNFTAAGFNDLKDDYESDVIQTYSIVLSDNAATTLTFSGFVTSLGIAVPIDDKVTCNVTIKISGQVTITT